MSETLTCTRCGFTREVDGLTVEDEGERVPISADDYGALLSMAGMELLCEECAPAIRGERLGEEQP
jgi:hypothetical protein